MRVINNETKKQLSLYQIERFIRKEQHVEQMKELWKERCGLPYPYRYRIKGICKYDRGDPLEEADEEFLKEWKCCLIKKF
ncbi:hypothetical protein SAMN05421677_10841 [Halobacillus aidingensis]|uniref:Uncharacterized protein n=1 Tax=Halobacillus aidingensis TaxID=240303 RepID=A0A1H0MIE3_HALAD|nr:hypothetical protein SAMN05421677_10841 [Halobacillus aidingensis]